MTKESAKRILEEWLSENKTVTLPIVDMVIYLEGDKDFNKWRDWTFKGLIKIAYDLEDVK